MTTHANASHCVLCFDVLNAKLFGLQYKERTGGEETEEEEETTISDKEKLGLFVSKFFLVA